MRGIFFQQPLEFRLEVDGDEWRQGDRVVCKLSVKNRGSAPEALNGLFLHLAVGSLKKVKQKAADAFQIIASAEFGPPAAIEPEQLAAVEFSIQLDTNCVISDKQQSLFLVCGRDSLEHSAGNLQLNVLPHAHIEALTSLLEVYFSFVLKGQKSKKGWVESKLKPPQGKLFVTLDHLLLMSRFQGDLLELNYVFKRNKLTATAASMSITKAIKEFPQQLEPNQYIMSGGFVDNDALLNFLREALVTVESNL